MTPPGLLFFPEYITPEDEQTLAELLPEAPLRTHHDRNTVIRYGARRAYTSGKHVPKIPEPLQTIGQRLVSEGKLIAEPTHVTANEFHAGNSLAAHVDNRQCGPVITVLSLLSPATIVFSRKGYDSVVVEVLPRTLYQMTQESRYLWTHAVAPLAARRLSFVFRA